MLIEILIVIERFQIWSFVLPVLNLQVLLPQN